jgi:hypothetical protein
LFRWGKYPEPPEKLGSAQAFFSVADIGLGIGQIFPEHPKRPYFLVNNPSIMALIMMPVCRAVIEPSRLS